MADDDPLADFPCPSFLTGHAREEWERVVPLLSQQGTMSPLKIPALQAYCGSYGEWRSELEIVGSEDADGEKRSLRIGRALRQMRAFMADLGMLKAPAKQPDPPAEDDDPLNDLRECFSDIEREHTH